MRSSLDGERMMMPEMESRQPTLIPPTPYSIAPLGYDLRPASPPAKRSVVLGAFGAGSFFGMLIMGTVILAWSTAHPPSQSAAAIIAAHPAAPVCPPVLPVATPAPAGTVDGVAPGAAAASASGTPADATASNASGAAPATSDGAASKHGKASATKRYVAPHKAKQPKVGGGGGGLAASSNDDAFMKAIRASSH
jgi:hypothetical protein